MAKGTSQKIPYYRILEIDAEIATGRYPNRSSLSEKLEVSVSTIQHDIDFMKYILRTPIENYRDGYRGINGYYYTEETFRLPAIFASEEEVIAGAIASKLLAQYNNTSIYKHVKNIFAHFDRALYDKNKNWVEDRIVIMEEYITEKSDDNFLTLLEAINKDYFVTFKYKSHNEDNYIAPYQLLLTKSNGWILVGYNKTTDKVNHYDLDIIKSIEIIKEHFKIDENFTLYTVTDKI